MQWPPASSDPFAMATGEKMLELLRVRYYIGDKLYKVQYGLQW